MVLDGENWDNDVQNLHTHRKTNLKKPKLFYTPCCDFNTRLCNIDYWEECSTSIGHLEIYNYGSAKDKSRYHYIILI